MRILVTGGAGFIGSNTVHHFLGKGEEVIVLDDLSRHGSEKNLDWLKQEHGEIPFERVDIRHFDALKGALARYGTLDAVLHFAAQVAVTTSVEDPRTDFDINALGTLHVLEAIRQLGINPMILYTSTNKVYGALESVGVEEGEQRYRYAKLTRGISEEMPLDFYSPYGCSKGAADQYVRDYHRIYGLRTAVFRNSCIYGPRQFGIEDQGWLAWFAIAAVMGRPITIYGNGKQVRDVLYINDLVEAMERVIDKFDTCSGEIYNIGGGPENSLAVWTEFGPILEELLGKPIPVEYGDWRPGDQPVFVSDISKARRDFGWVPKTGIREGVDKLVEWVQANVDLFA